MWLPSMRVVHQVSSSVIIQRNLSLVVAIWDQDTDSRDDYMAGVSCGGISNNGIILYYFRYELD